MPHLTIPSAVDQADQAVETRTSPTVDQVAEAIRKDAAQAHEYLDESVVPFGGE